MLRALVLSLLSVALTAPSPAAGTVQEGDQARARALVEAAAAASAALTSGTYQARSAVSVGTSATGSSSGEVRFARLEGDEALGSKLFIRAKAPDATGLEVPFRLSYDGQLVRGQLGEEKIVWYSPFDQAGSELLEVGQQLVMDALLSPTAFEEALSEGALSLGSEVSVGGVACREVVCEFGERQRHKRVTWALSTEDGLPRRRIAQLHRRGVFQTETLEIAELRPNVGIHPSVFAIPTPADYTAQTYVSRRPQLPELLSVGTQAPELALRDSEGGQFKLSERRGKVIVLDFWATWCPPCRQAMPGVQSLHERFKDDDRVEVWGLATQERKGSDPAAYMEQGGFTYGLLLNGERVAPAFRVAMLPSFYVIGTGGEVLHASVGFDPALDKKITALIEGHLK